MTGPRTITTSSFDDDEGKTAGQGTPAEGVEGVARFHALVREHVDDPAEVVVATETDRGLFVGSLIAAGYRGVRRQPAVGGPLPGTALDLGGQVRSG